MATGSAVAKARPGIKPGIYRHYEGVRQCKVIAVTRDAETGEEVVIYQELFGMHLWKVVTIEMAAKEFFHKVKDKNFYGPCYELIKEF